MIDKKKLIVLKFKQIKNKLVLKNEVLSFLYLY